MDRIEPVVAEPVSKAVESARESAVESFASLTHFGGFDWAMSEHQFAMVDRDGSVLMNLRFNDDAEGWASLRKAIAPYPHLGVAIETSTGPAVERLLEIGLVVSSVTLLTRSRIYWYLGIGASIVGVVSVVWGLLIK